MSLSNTANAVLAFSVCALSTALHAQDAVMTPEEIQSAWVGKTVIALITSGPSMGRVVELQLKADGSAELTGAAADSGAWRLSDKGYCATWKKIRAGKEGCFTVVRKGSELLVLNADGSPNTTVTAVR
ncbi:MAG: hypothetical protein EAZ34_06775 [Polaromonas sp.]|nr:MAG: hypothetical protein EAZ34_06775 [Polaromonas sp.]